MILNQSETNTKKTDANDDKTYVNQYLEKSLSD